MSDPACVGNSVRLPPAAGRRRFRHLLLTGCWLLGLAGSGWAEVGILVSGQGRFHQEVAVDLAAGLRERFPDHNVAVTGLAPNRDTGDRAALLITIGSEACEAVMESAPSRPQLCLAVTSETWRGLSAGREIGGKAAIFIDQPVARYLYLARAVAPDARRYGALLGPVSSVHEDELHAAAGRLNAGLQVETASLGDNPLRLLSPLFSRVEVFVAIPDQAAFNRSVARWALHLGFRHKVPLIGFSRSYADAGAAASLYTAPPDVTRQALAWLERYFDGSGPDLWRGVWPRYFTVTVNPSVVRSLRLPGSDEGELHRRVSEWIEREDAQ